MTREEALNEIRSWAIPSEKGREVLETLIPELAESEDEMIRKELINWINGKTTYEWSYEWCENKDRWIAYLEKLKEANKAIEAVDRIDKYIDEHLANAHDMKDSNPDKKYYRGWDDALGKMAGILQDVYSGEKQKEQKPDSLIYDKDLDKAAREFYLSGGADSPFDSTGLVPIVRMAEFGATWMKERMEKEQKPAEWNPNNEDVTLFNKAVTTNPNLTPSERAKLDIIRMKFKRCNGNTANPAEWSEEHIACIFEKVGLAKIVREQGNDDLTNAVQSAMLELSKVENTEWSEEDRKMLDDCIMALSNWRDAVANYGHEVVPCQKLIDWLKSLRPSWKPSKEQMEAVKHAYNSFPNDCSTKSNLRLLYYDLEKLM